MEQERIYSELDSADWAVVGSTQVLQQCVTYKRAAEFAGFCQGEGISGVTVVAQIVAERMLQNKLNKEGQ